MKTMTLEEAIKHADEVAIEQTRIMARYDSASGYARSRNEAIRTESAKKCEQCAAEHRQLAEWLKELKNVKDIIRQHDEDSMPEDFWYIDKIREAVQE